MGRKFFWAKKNLGQKFFGSKNLGRKFFWVKKCIKMWLKKNEHLRNSKQCCGQDVKESFGYWNRRNFNMKDISVKDTAWPMHIYSYSGVIFAVYPIKSGGQIYFVLVMFASEAECSKYEFEMIVHERGSWALDSVMSVKFCGNPLGHILSTSSRSSTHQRILAVQP